MTRSVYFSPRTWLQRSQPRTLLLSHKLEITQEDFPPFKVVKNAAQADVVTLPSDVEKTKEKPITDIVT